ncbi:hypothetical protein FACS189456_0140 [Bacteroidia bacterium]|nr:hypothetical protein FACS189456_0140 [Bacteroidia bacterium]
MKKLSLSVAALLLGVSAYADQTWNCGYPNAADVTAILTEADSTLTVSGTGAMINSTAFNAPWYSSCTAIKTIIIEEGITNIGNWSFYACNNLTSINFPNSVTNIGDQVFQGCSRLTNVNILNSITNIGNGAFSYSGLTSITIPSSVTHIGDGAFTRCYGLAFINVSPDNADYSAEDGVLFDKNKTALLRYPNGKVGTTYTIPNSVTSIGQSAFMDCSTLISLSISNGVTNIGQQAFSYCNNLTALNVATDNDSYSSEYGVLFNKNKSVLIQYPKGKGETSYIIPNSVTRIERDAFGGCHNLTAVTIPNSVTSIGFQSFDGCDGLTSITIPGSVAIIEAFAFEYCYGLTSVTNLNPKPLTDICTNCTFYGVDIGNITLYTPACALFAYQNAEMWKDFDTIIGNELLPCIPYYHISYNAGGGTGAMLQTDSIMANSNYTIRTNGFTKTGYIFAGWKDGNNASYAEGATINNVNASITLTAQWTDMLSYINDLQAHLNALQTDSVNKQTQIGTLQSTLNDTISALQAQLALQPDTVYVPQDVYVHDTVTTTPAVNISVSGASMFPSIFNPANTEYMVNGNLNTTTVITITIGDTNYALTIPQSNNATAIQAKTMEELDVFPNPTATLLTITNDQWQAGDLIEIYSINGTLKGTWDVASKTSTINIGHLPTGVYIVKVGDKVAKVVKQ